jgi:hypothetical protein
MKLADVARAMMIAGCNKEQIGAVTSALSAPPKEKSKNRTSLTYGVRPSERDIEAATARGIVNGHAEEQWTKFVDYHVGKGTLMADWGAAWRTWLGNVKQYSGGPRGGPPSRGWSLEDMKAEINGEPYVEQPDHRHANRSSRRQPSPAGYAGPLLECDDQRTARTLFDI